MRRFTGQLLILIFAFCVSNCRTANKQKAKADVKLLVTSFDKSSLLKEIDTTLVFEDSASSTNVLAVDTTQKFQEIDGFGFALTGGSAQLIKNGLLRVQKDSLLQDLFSANGIGVSYVRISMGASDLDDHVFSYSDLPKGEKDLRLEKFSIAPDKENLLPILKEILTINPDLKIMATPWSAPSWMKTNDSSKGGSLKLEFYKVYANYFVNYIKAMEGEGIKIEAITLQNEPENPNNNPSMLMNETEEALFVKQFLGPAFRESSIKTKIIVFDHNADHPAYPLAILSDKDAAQFIDGSAFHLYLGEISALSKVHEAQPKKNIYFTEQWTGAKGDFGGDLSWHIKNVVIGATQNWAKTVIEWNLASDSNYGPHTDGGCTECLGAITIDKGVKKNVSYYIIAHASKYVKPGSFRIKSSENVAFPHVAFLTPEGTAVLIILNDANDPASISLKIGTKFISTTLASRSVSTIAVPL